MFEAIELGQTLSKPEFKAAESKFRVELLELQRQLAEANVATLIIVAGVEGGGKGDVVDSLNKWFDSRGIETHAFWDETDEERERPDYWRYWRRLPPVARLASCLAAGTGTRSINIPLVRSTMPRWMMPAAASRPLSGCCSRMVC